MFNLDFLHTHYLWLLLLVPAVWLLYFLARKARRAKLKRFGNPQFFAHLMPMVSRYKSGIKITLELIALTALVIMIARPRAGETDDSARAEGIEVVVAFDVSNSMKASATGDENGTSRIDQATMVMEQLIDRLGGDRVGLMAFANHPKMQMPLTTDYTLAKMYLHDLKPDLIRDQGTNIPEALRMAMRAFSSNNDVGKAVILITDTENHEGDAAEMAAQAKANGIQVNVIGVGSKEKVRIPTSPNSGDYMIDYQGNQILTSLNESAAEEIAKAGAGIYVNATNPDALDKLTESLDKTLDKKFFGSVKYKASAEQFPVFAWLALVLLIADIFVLERKTGWLSRINFFTRDNAKKNKDTDTSTLNPEKK